MATTATADFPGLTLEVDFVTGANTAAATWTDITAYLRSFTIRRGRQRELDRFEAGTMSLVLDNRDRRFDPEYSAGPHFGNLLPMRQIRLRATWSAVTYDLFRGYIDGWPQAYPSKDKDSIATVEATDGFKVLALAQPLDSVYAIEVDTDSPSAWWRLGETTGITMGDSSGNGNHGTYVTPVISNQPGIVPYSGSNGALEFDGVDDAGTASYARVHATAPFTVEAWVKIPDTIDSSNRVIYRQDSGLGTDPTAAIANMVQMNLVGSSGLLFADSSDASYALPYGPVTAGTTYHMVYVFTATPGILYIQGAAQADPGSGAGGTDTYMAGAVVIGGMSTGGFANWLGLVDEVAIYSTALSAARVLAHYNGGANPWNGDASGTRVGRILDAIAWPASLRDIDTGTSTLGPASWDQDASALQILQDIAQTETAYMFMTGAGSLRFVGRNNRKTEAAYSTSAATFGDSGAELPYADIVTSYDDQQIRNVAKVSRRGGIPQTYEDATSKAAYGPRTIAEDGLLMASDNEAYDRAIWRVLVYKDPAWRVDSLVMNGRSSPSTLWPQLLGRELGERITVARRPQGIGSAISKAVHIEGVEHRVDSATWTWDTTWYVSPVDPLEASWAIVGSGAAKNQVGTAKVSY